jgi:hypothetical protein
MKELDSIRNTGGSACSQADADSPEAQEKLPGGGATIRNALRTTRSTFKRSREDGTANLDLSARPISF